MPITKAIDRRTTKIPETTAKKSPFAKKNCLKKRPTSEVEGVGEESEVAGSIGAGSK